MHARDRGGMPWCNPIEGQYLNSEWAWPVFQNFYTLVLNEKIFFITHRDIYQNVHVLNNIILKEENKVL